MSEEEFEWQKACEAENNFQKAVEMVTSIFFPQIGGRSTIRGQMVVFLSFQRK